MTTEETRAVVRDLYDAYARGDRERIAARIAEDVDWIIFGPMEVFPFGGVRRGKAAALAALDAIGKEYALQRYAPEILIADGEHAAVLSDVSFEQRATGRTLRLRIANFLQVREGRVVRFREFFDSFDAVQQAIGKWIEL